MKILLYIMWIDQNVHFFKKKLFYFKQKIEKFDEWRVIFI